MDHEDLVARARSAMDIYDGHPYSRWSTSEQLAIALVLDDTAHLAAMGYTVLEAVCRVGSGLAAGTSRGDTAEWLRTIQHDKRTRRSSDALTARPRAESAPTTSTRRARLPAQFDRFADFIVENRCPSPAAPDLNRNWLDRAAMVGDHEREGHRGAI